MTAPLSNEDVTLESLVGEHELTGVDFGNLPRDDEAYRYEDAETCSFVLDGKVYTAVEDPSDGYRSCMRRLFIGGEVRNTFVPCRVLCSMRTRGEYGGEDDILEMRDTTTGERVLEIGTRNTDDYYPCWTANFHPEAMACNKTALEKSQ